MNEYKCLCGQQTVRCFGGWPSVDPPLDALVWTHHGFCRISLSVRRGGIEKDVSEVLLAGVTFARFFSATLCILEYLWAVSTVPIDLEGLLAKKPNKGTRVHTIPLCYLLLRAICHY